MTESGDILDIKAASAKILQIVIWIIYGDGLRLNRKNFQI